ncbi:MAG: deoxyribose-phosphate aldolase [Verrucomicrobiota bacterium]
MINQLIDHTYLKQEGTLDQITQLCQEAVTHQFWSVCIHPYWVPDAAKLTQDSPVRVCTVVGFPLGANLSRTKVHETADAIHAGATEIDMVINIGAALEGHWNFIEHEIHEIVSAADSHLVKVILETASLSPEQIKSACHCAENAGAGFVKTSTGFGKGGATVEAVELMKASVSENLGIKASGGIKSADQAQAMIKAGATRLGTSSGIAIIQGSQSQSDY